VASVLVALPLGDRLELEPAAQTRVDAPGLAGGDTLVTHALALLAARAGHGGGWRVRIEKRVPAGAGLGGGSADAAAALGLANATLPEPLPHEELVALSAAVGSDVPFFVSARPSALARGRGELLEPCPLRAPAWVVIGWPGVALATAEVYARYRPEPEAARRVASLSAEPFATADAEGLARLVANDLAAPAEELCSPVAALRAGLLAGGALAACVSGSGSAVFGLFANEDAAREADGRLRRDTPWVAVARLTPGAGPDRITV
jgi:4-diphosphocytidyl-2-C-methyl-D-erythritol kinase